MKTVTNNSEVSKSWFAMLPNPAEHGYEGTPEEACKHLRDEWIKNSETRTGAWAYCRSADGLLHVHMVLEDSKSMRFSAIKAAYPKAHIEATRGTKAQAEDYINKRPPYDEKGEEVIYILTHGEIRGRQGTRSDLEVIQNMIEAGMTPAQIMREDIAYRRYRQMIREAFFDKRSRETPVVRNVKVHYIVGPPGSGKSYHYPQLCAEYGEDKIYHLSDYEGGGFDLYCGEPVLILDEFKDQFPFSKFLTIIDCYKTQVHARYANVMMLWSEVYVTTVFPPEVLYQKMVSASERDTDDYAQLTRRITDITYCFRSSDGEFQTFTLPMACYTTYSELVRMATEEPPFPP